MGNGVFSKRRKRKQFGMYQRNEYPWWRNKNEKVWKASKLSWLLSFWDKQFDFSRLGGTQCFGVPVTVLYRTVSLIETFSWAMRATCDSGENCSKRASHKPKRAKNRQYNRSTRNAFNQRLYQNKISTQINTSRIIQHH